MSDQKPAKKYLFDIPGITPSRKKQPEAAPGLYYATLNRRMLAALIDSVLIVMLFIPPLEMIASSIHGPVYLDVPAIMHKVEMAPPSEAGLVWAQELKNAGVIDRWILSSFLQTIVLGAVTILFWDYFAATPGKMLLRVGVVDAKTLKPISNLQSFLRFFGYIVSTIPLMIGFFSVSFDKKRQGWHDKIAGTVVVLIPKGKKITDVAAMAENEAA